MTVKELIEHLQTLDPETHVFTAGYEGGFNHAVINEEVEMALDYHKLWWYGDHEYANEIHDKSKYKIVKGIVL